MQACRRAVLAAGLFLFTQLPAQADVDTVVRDFDIDIPQAECLQIAIRLFQSLAAPGVPVRELRHIVYYTDASSELIAVCRADRDVLVLFTRGPLTGPAHIGINRALH